MILRIQDSFMSTREICNAVSVLLLLLFAALADLCTLEVQGKIIEVSPGEDVQGVLDSETSNGDIISFKPGVYVGPSNSLYGLRISNHNITLRALGTEPPGNVRLLSVGAQQTGVYVAPPGCEYRDNKCAKDNIQGFIIDGISVENFPANGIQTRWVNDFQFLRSVSLDNLNNGLYPTYSKNGLIYNCTSSGSLDSGLWVAGSENVQVTQNEIYESTTGLEITVSRNVTVINNVIHNNVVGIGLYHPNMAGTNPSFKSYDNWNFINNYVYGNNLPNTSPPDTFQSFLPSGIGILVVGVSGHSFLSTTIAGHYSAGLVVSGYCTTTEVAFDSNCDEQPPRNGDASVNDNTFFGNFFSNNGGNPSESLAKLFPPGQPLDILYAQTQEELGGNGVIDNNCFSDNTNDREPNGEAFALALALPISTRACDIV